MIADTRVSFHPKGLPPQDCLIKVYEILGPSKAAALGFCGNNLSGIRAVMTYLKERKFQHYKRRFVLVNLKHSLRDWIEERAITLAPEQRDGLKFMLCGVEPCRHPPVKLRNGSVGSLPVPEAHLYVYSVSKDTGKVGVTACSRVAVIGSGEELTRKIETEVNGLQRFGQGAPQLYWAREFVTSSVVASMFEDGGSEDVGGLFQVVRITPRGIERDWVLPPSCGPQNVIYRKEGDRLIVSAPALGKQYTLYTIWNCPFARKPAQTGSSHAVLET